MPWTTRRCVRPALLLLLAGGALWAWWSTGPPEPAGGGPATGPAERCLDCHDGMTGFSPFHAAVACTTCHRGDPADGTEAGAHAGLVAVPGNLATAEETCGQGCHGEIVARVRRSLMATGRGLVAVDRWVFGEQPTPDGTAGLADLGHSDADTHLRQLCSTCHLGHEKAVPGPVTEASRGGGCVACHLQYPPAGQDADPARVHPALTLQVTDDHCFGCHSRSGRISTSYAGWHETPAPPGVPGPEEAGPNDRRLADGRRFVRVAEDVHHARGLACIDCHTARETMGDGEVYRHQDAAVAVRCTTCHRAEAPQTLGWDDLDAESRTIVAIRTGRPPAGRRFLQIEQTGLALLNAFLDAAGRPVLEGKLSGRRYALPPPAAACTQAGHERLSCQSCHTAWAPQCVGCHTQRDAGGQWQEFVSDFFAEPPTLGVRVEAATGRSRIEPFAPGMIMTLNRHPRAVDGDAAALAAEGSFHRLFAPAVPHTTAAVGRACTSCHNDPLALGYGRGALTLTSEEPARWSFTPAFGPLRDGLPADAWIPFFGTRTGPVATRVDARPFDRAEQQRILRVGACLTCHPADPAGRRRIYDRFADALPARTAACRVPVLIE